MGTQTHTHESVLIDTQCTLGGQAALQRRFLPYETGGPLRFGRRLHADGDAGRCRCRRRHHGGDCGDLVGQVVERLQRAAGRQRRLALHRRRCQAVVDGVLVAQEEIVEATASRRPAAGRLQVRLSVSTMLLNKWFLGTMDCRNTLTSCRRHRHRSLPPP